MRFLGGLLALLLSASAAFGQGVPGQAWTNAVLNAPVTTTPGGTDVLAIIQGGITKQITYGNLLLGGGTIPFTQITSQVGNFAGVPIFGTPCTQPNPFCQPFVNTLSGSIGAGNQPSIGLVASYTHPGTVGLLLAPLWSQIWDNGSGLSTALALNTNLYGSNPTAMQGLSMNQNIDGTNAGSFSANIEAETIMMGVGNIFGLILEAGGDGVTGHGMNSFISMKGVGLISGHPCDSTHDCTKNVPAFGIAFATDPVGGSTAPYNNPIQLTGSLMTITGTNQFVAANGIDLSNSGGGGTGITGCAYKSQGLCIDGSGNVGGGFGDWVNFPGSLSAGNGYTGGGSTQGFVFGGSGSGTDILAVNKNKSSIWQVPTGTVNIQSFGSLTLYNGTSIPAGGTASAGLMFSNTANFGVFFGSSAPTLSAAHGSIYLRSDGNSSSTRAYINTDGGTTWTSITTGS